MGLVSTIQNKPSHGAGWHAVAVGHAVESNGHTRQVSPPHSAGKPATHQEEPTPSTLLTDGRFPRKLGAVDKIPTIPYCGPDYWRFFIRRQAYGYG